MKNMRIFWKKRKQRKPIKVITFIASYAIDLPVDALNYPIKELREKGIIKENDFILGSKVEYDDGSITYKDTYGLEQ